MARYMGGVSSKGLGVKLSDHHPFANPLDTIEAALSRAERAGFKIAVIGRTMAIMLMAFSYLFSFYFPINLGISALTAVIALIGPVSLAAVGTCYEKQARYGLFAFDAAVVTIVLAFVPLSSGGDVPQNLVFLTSIVQHYYLVVAAAVLTLSPPLVLWTGAWSAGGLVFATLWILSGMEHVLSYGDLPISPTRDVFIATVLNPDFLGIASRVQEILILASVTAIAALAVHRARRVVRDHANAKASQRHMRNLFGRYVPSSVLPELLNEGHLAPQMRPATLLFADIEGFTRISEGMHPTRLVQLLNEFFSAVTEIVDRHGGVVISYLGDAVLVSFNAPRPVEMQADRAVSASRDILTMVAGRQFDSTSLRVRIGIATGPIAAGTVGTGDRQAYTLYGDAVNLSQRLQELNKEMGTNCLICGATTKQMSDPGLLTSLGMIPIRNLGVPIEIYRHAEMSFATY